MREYRVQFYMKDIMGREIEGESEKLTIDSDKMVHREELVLINFNFAGTTAKSEYIESRIENVAREILKRAEEPIKKMHVEIGGHTDVIGMYDANMELSEERAITELGHLKSFLIKYLEISDDAALDKWLADRNISLSAKGYGPQVPYEINVWQKGYIKTLKLGDNETPEGRILNRRVSAKIDVEM